MNVPRGDVSEKLARRIAAEFSEMPGLQVTVRQAKWLFGLTEAESATLLEHLTDSGILTRLLDGRYMRRDTTPRRRPAAAQRKVHTSTRRRTAA